LKTPVSLATKWVVESLLVHVTVVPAVTLKVCGEKAKLANVTRFPDAVFCVVELFPVLHAARKASEITITTKNTDTIVFPLSFVIFLLQFSVIFTTALLRGQVFTCRRDFIWSCTSFLKQKYNDLYYSETFLIKQIAVS
jgi:hypothetical protein